MLPTKGVLSEKIQSLVNNNDKTDSAEAVKEFADGLAKLLIDTMKEADVVFQSQLHRGEEQDITPNLL